MNQYYPLLYLVFTNQPCTKFHLEHLGRGKYKDLISECIELKYIEICRKNGNGDDLYCLTEEGKQIVDNPKGNNKNI